LSRIVAVLLCCCLAGLSSALVRRPVSVSFVPPLSTNGVDGPSTVSELSFNVIGGVLAEVHGLELGGVFSIARLNSSGCRLAGAVNVSGGSMRGFVAAPVNVVGAGMRGVQVGCVNVAADVNPGVQVGSVNITGDVDGVQVGNVNIGRNVWGAKVGNVNIADGANGLLFGNVNISGDLRGAGIGNVNISRSCRGFLLGNVNICPHLEGEALGNVSIIGNGYQVLSAWADETGVPQLGAKLGSRRIYNVFGIGAAPFAEDGMRWVFGYGLGVHSSLTSRLFLDVDAAAYAATESGGVLGWSFDKDLHVKLRPQLGFFLIRRLSVVAGPTLSVRIVGAPERLTRLGLRVAEGAWLGATAGVQCN